MLKLARRARGHFVTLIEIRVHLIRVKPGHISARPGIFGRTNSTTPSSEQSSKTLYTPLEECEGLSCQCSFKLLHFLCKVTGLAGQF